MIDILRGRKFSNKCKYFVRCIRSRLEPIRKKKQAIVRYLKKDVADLIAGGHESVAFGRIDALIVETNHTSCYDMIEKYCGCLLENLSTMRKERECPKEAMEAVATLIFAAARFSDLPELADLRLVFTKRFGTQINTCLNEEFVEKMRKKSFHKEKKLQLMQDIAQEYSVDWNVKAFEDKMLSPCPPISEQSKKHFPASQKDDKKDEAFNERQHQDTSYNVQVDASTDEVMKEEIRQTARYEPGRRNSMQKHQVRPEDQLDLLMDPKNGNIYSTDATGKIKNRRSLNQRREPVRHNGFHYDDDEDLEREIKIESTKASLNITEASTGPIVLDAAGASEQLAVASGRVHPRLPDYDDLTARIASLTSTST